MTGTPKNVAAAAGGIDDAVPSEILNEGSSWETSTLRRGRFRNDEGGDPDIDEAMERLSRRHAYRFAKRAFDIVFSCLFLALFCWFFVVVAVAVKLDDPKGPVLFRQTRITKDGREFAMYKFRSMAVDAEERLGELKAFNEKAGPVFKIRNDPRVTRVGRWLRRLSLDELPQFINVFKWTNLAISLLIVGIVALLNGPLAAAVGNPGLGIVLIVASLSLPITSLVSVQTVLYQRALDFKTLFSAQVGSSALILFVSVPLALLGFDYWSMIIGTVSSNVLLAIWLTVKSEWKPQFRYSLAELRRMFSFGVWVLLESLATWVNTWAGTFVLGALMSSYYVGLYKTSTNVCSSIMSVFTSAVIPIAFSALSRVQGDDERFESILLKMQRYLAMCIIPVSFCCLVYRHALTLLLLGGQWDETELFIGLWMFTGCINVVFGYMCSEAYRAKGCPSLCVFVQVAYLVPFLPCLYVSATLGYGCVSVVMPALRIVLAAINLTVLKMAFGVSPWRMMTNVWRVFVQSLIAVLPGIVVTALTDSLVVEVATAAFSVLIYLVLLFKCRGTREEAYALLDRLGLRKLALAACRALRRG